MRDDYGSGIIPTEIAVLISSDPSHFIMLAEGII